MSEPKKMITLPDEFPPKWANEWGEDEYGFAAGFTVLGNEREVRVLLRWIPPSKFLMGSPVTEPGRSEDETQHPVELTQGFWLSETSCTQALWEAVMGHNPSRFKGEDRPVESVSWFDTVQFLETLNNLVLGLDVRLPTEAEWEAACRAGTTTAYAYGNRIDQAQANYGSNETVNVKHYPPNFWGLYEMHGNVEEWVVDWYGAYPGEMLKDPEGPANGEEIVVRGGDYYDRAWWIRSAYRGHEPPLRSLRNVGFRMARSRKRSE